MPNLRRRSTCQTSSSKVFFIKDDMNVEVFNRTPKITILSNGVLNWDGVLKSGDKPKNQSDKLALPYTTIKPRKHK